eukprot:1745799-Amphidinium_carterae.1
MPPCMIAFTDNIKRPGTGGGDRVNPNEMPITLGASVFDAPDDNAVQWKAGASRQLLRSAPQTCTA